MKKVLRVLLLFSPLLLFGFSLSVGEKWAGPADIIRALSGGNAILTSLIRIRFSFALQALLCGGLLAVSGAAMQAVLRNPLAEPYILGVSSGSAFGMVVVSLFGASGLFWVQFGAAFAGGVFAVALVLGGALRRRRPLSMVRIILLGVAVNAFFSALTMLLQSFLDPTRFAASVGLLAGSISLRGWEEIAVALLIGFPALLFLWFRSPELDILSQGREEAVSIGLAVDRETVAALVCAAFAASVSVALCGIIGFVGLAAPHVVRALWGSGSRRLFPLSFIAGGSFLLLVSLLSRLLSSDSALPLTAMTALAGSPLFFWIIRSRGGTDA